MKKIITLMVALCLGIATLAFAGDRTPPVASQDASGNIALANTDSDAPNIYKYEGAPASFNVTLDNHGVPAVAFRQPDGKYTIALYADPEGGAVYCGDQDGGRMTEDMNVMHLYAPSRGYTYKYFLGNLIGPQRKKMPEGVLDPARRRVVFTNVELKPGMKRIRLNLPVKIFGPDGQEIKAPDPNGFYGWTTDDADKSVIGTPDNGYYFDVNDDGTIEAKGLDFRHPS